MLSADKIIEKKKCVIAMGIFDSLHSGHLKVLNKAKIFAEKNNYEFIVLTFDPHPTKITKGIKEASRLILPLELRLDMLKEFGAKKIIVQKFDKKFSKISPDEFINLLMKNFPNLRALAMGENFRFGKNATGDVKWLNKNNKHIKILSAINLQNSKKTISSSRLRIAIAKADLKSFKQMTKRDYFAIGKVISGKKLGRKIGFPTLNLSWNPECKLPYGVYAVKLENLNSKREYFGVANYGISPTIDNDKKVLVETNLFENVKFGVGTTIKVSFLKFLRTEKKFSSLESLKKAIAIDKEKALRFLS